MDLEKLKDYIQQELEKITGNKEELNQTKEQLSLFKTEFDNLFINNELDTFQELFKQNELGMSFEKVKEAVSVITFFNQLNTTDIPQYQDAYNDLQELKKQIDVLITSIDDKIQIIENNNDKFNILKDALDILNKEDLNGFYNDEEISKLFNAIKVLTIDAREKMDLIYNITSINVQKKLTSRVENSIKISSDDLVLSSIEENIDIVTELLDSTDEYSDELIQESDVLRVDEVQTNVEETIDDPLLDKIQELVNQLSKYYDVQNFGEITSQAGILERKEIYSSNNEISKYNWPLIYVDLCKNLIPMYKEGNNKDQIRDLFEFIIEKYTNYESVCEEFDNETVLEINKYLNMIDNIDEEDIRYLYGIMKTFIDSGLECNLSEIVQRVIPYSNEKIVLYYTIFELKNDYNDYKEYRADEFRNRFSSDLASSIEYVKQSKKYLLESLNKIQNIEQEISVELSTRNNEDSTEFKSVDASEEEGVKILQENEPINLIAFMPNESYEIDFINIVNGIISQGNHQITLRNMLNNISDRHFMCRNYIGITKTKHTGYKYLKPTKKYKNLELFTMYRSRKGDIRCVYHTIHLSEYNKKIIQKYYPNFNGILFLITNIFLKPSDDLSYIGDTNNFIGRNQLRMNEIINLFKIDFQTEEDVSRALSIINESFNQYNSACSYINEKKVGGK